MKIIVVPYFLFIFLIKSINSLLDFGSKNAVASSNIIISGLCKSTDIKMTFLFCPEDNLKGDLSKWSFGKLNSSMISFNLESSFELKSISSLTVLVNSWWVGYWNDINNLFVINLSFLDFVLWSILILSILIFPSVGLIIPNRIFANVVLPEPDLPTILITSPFFTEKETFSRAVTSWGVFLS